MLAPGTKLGPYEVLAQVGAGGMGVVYQARDTRLERDVAIKMLPVELAEDPERLRRFEKEAKATGSLNHPNIVAVYDFGTQEEAPFLVMELLEGQTLREHLQQQPVTPRRAVEIAKDLAHGLAAAHEKGIIHRDLKPENIFLTRDGRVKILDFGLARTLPAALGAAHAQAGMPTLDPGQAPANQETHAGLLVGTVGYMSPEQVRAEKLDGRSDIFALGVVVWEMLAGVPPFQRASGVEVLHAILKEDPSELRLGSSHHLGLEGILRRCLAKDPAGRFQSAHDLTFALESVWNSVGASSPQASSPGPFFAPSLRASKWRAILPKALLVSGVLAACALAGLALMRPSTPIPTFHRLTYHRGSIEKACFAAGGQSVVFSAKVGGGPSTVFSVTLGNVEPTQLGPDNVALLDVSRSNELALMLNPRLWSGAPRGTLARAPLNGQGIRELGEDILEALWNREGTDFAAIRKSPKESYQIEYPLGKVLYLTPNRLSRLAMAPEGDRLAFVEENPEKEPWIHLMARDGRKHPLAPVPKGVSLVWSPDQEELLVAGIARGQTTLSALGMDGKSRVLWCGAGGFRILSAGAGGRALLCQDQLRIRLAGRTPERFEDAELGWLEGSEAVALSRDGKLLVFNEVLAGGGSAGMIYLRKMDGSPAVRVGPGRALDLSPDGRTVLALPPDRGRLDLIPTGPGQTRSLPLGDLSIGIGGWFHPDGKRIVIEARKPGQNLQLHIMDLESGLLTPLTPPEMAIWKGQRPLSPDGTRVAVTRSKTWSEKRAVWIWPLNGGEPQAVAGIQDGDVMIDWTEDGKGLRLFDRDRLPAEIVQLDIATGRRVPWRTLKPADQAGIGGIQQICLAQQGGTLVFTFNQNLGELYLVEGLK